MIGGSEHQIQIPFTGLIPLQRSTKLALVILLVQVQIDALHFLGLTLGQGVKCALTPRSPPATKTPLQDAAEAVQAPLHCCVVCFWFFGRVGLLLHCQKCCIQISIG